MTCELCKKECGGNTRYCGRKCQTLARLRGRATKSLLDADERAFGQGYDSVEKRVWIKKKLNDISSGAEDAWMYRMFLERTS